MNPQKKPKVLVLDQEKVVGLMRVTSYLIATDTYTTIKNVESENIIEWGLSAVTRRKLLEISTEDVKINKYKKELLKSFVETWERKIESGPSEALSFIEYLEKKKKYHHDILQRKYNIVLKRSEKVIEDTTTAIKVTAAIKLGSTITTSILSNFTPAGFVITYLQENAMEFVSNLGEAKSADSIAIANAAAGTLPTAIIGGVDHAYEDGTVWAMDKISAWADARHYNVYKNIRGSNFKVPAQTAFKATNSRFSDTFLASKKATKVLGNRGGVKVFGHKIPGLSIVFTGKDIFDAVKQYKEDIAK